MVEACSIQILGLDSVGQRFHGCYCFVNINGLCVPKRCLRVLSELSARLRNSLIFTYSGALNLGGLNTNGDELELELAVKQTPCPEF